MMMPERLIEAFDGDQDLLRWVEDLRDSWQREIARIVMQPKSDEARQRRCNAMAERLLLTMEAERELPQFLIRRLQAARSAQAGWERMTKPARQTFLLTIFGARSEAARENQIIRMLEACIAKANAANRRKPPEP